MNFELLGVETINCKLTVVFLPFKKLLFLFCLFLMNILKRLLIVYEKMQITRLLNKVLKVFLILSL